MRVNVDEVAVGMFTQPVGVVAVGETIAEGHASHWNVGEAEAPAHVPLSPVNVCPTRGSPVIVTTEVLAGKTLGVELENLTLELSPVAAGLEANSPAVMYLPACAVVTVKLCVFAPQSRHNPTLTGSLRR